MKAIQIIQEKNKFQGIRKCSLGAAFVLAFVFILIGGERIHANAQGIGLSPLTVVLASPTSNQTLCCTINLAADVTGGFAQRVEFWVIQGANTGTLFIDFDMPFMYPWDTMAENIPSGTYTLAAKAYDVSGNFAMSNLSTINIFNNVPIPPVLDTIPPTVAVVQPTSGQTVSGIAILKVDASDNVGIGGVKFFREGDIFLGGDTTFPYEYGWDTTAVPDGSYTLYARAYDTSNNVTTSSLVSVLVSNKVVVPPPSPDTTPPVVSFISPTDGAILSGSVILEASASDNVGIAEVIFYRGTDNPIVIGSDTTSPYTAVWDTASVTDGTYTLKAVAFDASKNFSYQPLVVVISNQKTIPPPIVPPPDTVAPVISEIHTTSPSVSGVTIGWLTDEPSTSQVEYGISTNYGFTTLLDMLPVTSHVQDIAGLNTGTTYHFRVISKDTAGNISRSPDREFTTSLRDSTISGNILDEQNVIVTTFSGWVFARQLHVSNPLFFGGPVQGGSFSFSVLPGTYEVGIEVVPNSGYVAGVRQEVILTAGKQVVLTLRVQSAKATLTGTLKDPGGSAVTGVAATVFVTGSNSTWIEASVNVQTGKFSMMVVPGTWNVGVHVISSSGYFAKPILNPQISVSSGQTIVRDVFVTRNESVISGNIFDISGKPLPEAWVSVDQESGIASPLSLTGSPIFSVAGGKTDGTGAFRFIVPPGNYFIHAYLPFSLGLVNPEGVRVLIGTGETKSITLVARSSNVRISGNILLDGVGTSAFVFAWSEKGGVAETRATLDGAYSFSITGNDTWHLGATKTMETAVYRSQEVVVIIGDEATLSRNLTLVKTPDVLPAFVSTTATVSSAQSVFLNDGAKVVIPEEAVSVAGNTTITVIPTNELFSSATALPVGIGYDINVRDEGGNQITVFTKDISIQLPYKKEKLDALGVLEDDLIASSWDENSRTWKKLETFAINKTNEVVVVTLNHLTRFALIAPAAAAAPSVTGPSEGQPLQRRVTSAVDLREGDLIRGPDGIRVYIINGTGYKRHIFNPAIFGMYGHLKWENIKEVSQVTLDLYAVSDLYRADIDPKVYSLEEIDEARGVAIKHWLDMTPVKFSAEGYVWGQVFVVNEKERDYYQTGNPIIR